MQYLLRFRGPPGPRAVRKPIPTCEAWDSVVDPCMDTHQAVRQFPRFRYFCLFVWAPGHIKTRYSVIIIYLFFKTNVTSQTNNTLDGRRIMPKNCPQDTYNRFIKQAVRVVTAINMWLSVTHSRGATIVVTAVGSISTEISVQIV